MRLGFGLITCQRVPGDPRSDIDLYCEAIELAEAAERLGYDSVWVSEHHFVDDGYMSSLLPTCAAIAARTSRITIGTGLVLAPLHEPVRLAEDAATVDLIAAGRFVLGLGLGWRPEEFEGLGLEVSDRVPRTRDAITICRQAWGDGLVESRGGIAVTPKPAQPGGPPIWIGAIAEPSVRRAAKVADGWMATRVTPESFAGSVRWMDEELDKAGRSREEFAVSMHVPVFAWHGDDAWERVRDSFNFVEYKYAHMLDARSMMPPSPPAPPLTSEREQELLAEQPIVGEPAQVAERILAYREQAGVDFEFIARNYWPGIDPAVQRETMTIFAEEVAPLLRDA
jgi:alkanesulfonate monooxygenase SsuD/methylene tetrahydromethanopterin reductase-like flavin-dependent oxidoreductase (luciferase family)